MIIKVILLVGVLLLGWLALRDRPTGNTLAVRRLTGVAIVVVGTALVLWPDITSWMAKLVGVGRGTDLLFYGCVLLFMFTAIAQGQRIFRLEQQLDATTRELALLESQIDTGNRRTRQP